MPSSEQATVRTALPDELEMLPAALALNDAGQLAMGAEEQQQWLGVLRALPLPRREAVGEALAALGYRLAEEGGAPTRPAVEVLLALASVVLGRSVPANVGIQGAEIGADARKRLSLSSSARPVPKGGALNVLGLRFGQDGLENANDPD